MTSTDTAILVDQEPVDDPSMGLSAVSLKTRALQGSMWTMLNFSVSQGARLASNLILTRLLVPEAFGTMLIVNVVLQGLHMFSDTGIGPSIIQNKRGDDPIFLNTAWTIQVCRGVLLFLLCLFLGWPLAIFYENSLLLWLLPIAGISALMDGLVSTGICTYHRHLRLGRMTAFELSAQAVVIIATITLALIYRNVWALVIGPVIGSVVKLFLSHTIFREIPNRFKWDKEAAGQFIRFGRWIFIATALTFVVTQGDKLILGKIFGDENISLLGMYGIAFFLSSSVILALRKFSSMLLLPLYSRLAEGCPYNFRRNVYKARLVLLGGALPILCVLVIWGQEIVSLIYPNDYAQVGWMLRILAAGNIFIAIPLTCSSVLLAVGDSFRHMIYLVAQAIFLVICMTIGGLYATQLGISGEMGLIVGVAIAPLLSYPFLVWAIKRHGVWMPWLDLTAFVSSGIVIGCGLLLFS